MMNEKVLHWIDIERRNQIQQWGGAEHDDEHENWEWFVFITDQLDKGSKTPLTGFRERMTKIAALAIAALESDIRKNDVVRSKI